MGAHWLLGLRLDVNGLEVLRHFVRYVLDGDRSRETVCWDHEGRTTCRLGTIGNELKRGMNDDFVRNRES